MNKIPIFILYQHDDENYIKEFKARFDERFEIRSSSIVKSDANISNINWARMVIVFIGNKTKNSDWVREIEYANSKGYQIIIIYLPGATEADNPPCLEDYSDSFVNWDDEQKIIDAINGIIVSDGSDGEARPSIGGKRDIC